MKKLIGLAISATALMSAAHAATNSPVGYWKTVDDTTGEAKSIVAIYEAPNHTLVGKVLKLFKEPDRTCIACDGDLHDKPIAGMVVMMNLKPSGNRTAQWSGGSILDPKNGKSYQCDLKLTDGGDKLNVRGYIGLPLFGRSQTWERVPEGF